MPTRLLVGILSLLMALPFSSLAQNKVISGTVTDGKDGSPVAGVSVTVKGSPTGTATGSNGGFSVTVPPSARVLVFSAVGFEKKEVSITDASSLTVSLKASSSSMDEVIVIGYGSQRRRDVTGAITRVGGDKLTSIPAPSFEAALQGKAPGVQVIQGSGLAGSGSVVRIRGVGSISAGGDPLYVVDGIPIFSDQFARANIKDNGNPGINSGGQNQNPLASINPNDIESIEVLKDAGAAGIYGSRGANGVILITTKKGKSGKPRFNYSNRFGFSTWAVRPKFLNGAEWLQMRQEAWENDGNTGQAPLPGALNWEQASKNNTDWWKLLTRTGFINEHNASMTAGNKWLKSYVGASYSNNESYIKGNAYTRVGFRGNFDFQVMDGLKISLNTAFNRGINKRVPAAWAGGLGDAMSTALPIYPVYNDDKTYFRNGANPIFRMDQTKWRNTENRLLGGLTIEYIPIKNLTLRAVANMDYMASWDDQFETALYMSRTDVPGIAKRYNFWNTNLTGTFTASYDWKLNDDHKLSFMAGTEAQEFKQDAYSADIYAYTDKPFWENRSLYKSTRDSLKAAGARKKNETDAWTFISFFGRINYNIKDKYIFQVLARADGSSKFGPNNKYGFFPAASAAWILSEENFMKDIKVVNFLKLRASYGVVGNADIPSGSYYYRISPGGNPFNGSPTLYPDNIGNPDLKWETLRNFDAAIEFGLKESRITGEIAYYNKSTIDQLLNSGIMPNTGFANAWRNLDGGKIINRGIELSLNVKVLDGKDLSWTVGGNISKNYNEVVSLGQLTADAVGGGTNDTRIIPGYPVGTNYLVRFNGVDPNDGLPTWLDNNGKVTKTFSLDYRVPVGSVIPDFIGGFNSAWTYKGLELSALFTYAIGGNLYDGAAKRQAGIVTDWNMREDLKDRWRKPGDMARYPRLTMSTSTYDGLSSEWQYNSTLFLYDADFLRLRELTLRYTIPSKTFRNTRIRDIKLFVTGMNLLTFTKYPGGDPEIARDFESKQDRNMSPNVTYLTPPQQKSVTFGLNINF